jgi:hypothetical protein
MLTASARSTTGSTDDLGADDYLGKRSRSASGGQAAALARRSRDPCRRCWSAMTCAWTRPAGGDQGRPFPAPDRKEFGVLEVLLAADGAVVSAEDLLERVWDEHTVPLH